MKKLLLALASVVSYVVCMRWAMDLATPRGDYRRALRLVGWIERQWTALDAALTRLHVWFVDRFELDRLQWEYLRRVYTPEMS